MKKLLITFIFSILTLPSFAQTPEELEAQLTQLQLENQSLTSQNNNFDMKIQEKEKELTKSKTELKQIEAKRSISEDTCKNISDEDIKLMQALAGGTAAISLVGTGAGVIKNVAGNIPNKNEKTKESSEPQPTTLKKSTTLDKAMNITTTATSAGATVTSAIALSKVKNLKDNIQDCIDSFN